MSVPKIMTIVGTRPEIIRLSRIIAELDLYTEHCLVHTGQNYDTQLNEVFFRDLQLRAPDYYLDAAGASAMETIAEVLVRTDRLLESEKPDAVLVYGDTNSCLAAIAAKRRRIPVFHMEAGNRSFDDRVPEEINRRILDHVSDINMPLTEHSRRYLIAEGVPAQRVIKTGSTLREVIEYYRPAIERSEILGQLELESDGYFVASCHREENVDNPQNLVSLLKSFQAVASRFDKPVILSVHPRTRNRIEKLDRRLVERDNRVRMHQPFGYLDYVQLQRNSSCVLSDSGTITEEAALLGFPAVTIRQAHERPEGMDEGVLVMTGLNPQSIVHAVDVVTRQAKARLTPTRVDDYEADCVSRKVVRIILSYIEYVKRTVWTEMSVPASSEFDAAA